MRRTVGVWSGAASSRWCGSAWSAHNMKNHHGKTCQRTVSIFYRQSDSTVVCVTGHIIIVCSILLQYRSLHWACSGLWTSFLVADLILSYVLCYSKLNKTQRWKKSAWVSVCRFRTFHWPTKIKRSIRWWANYQKKKVTLWLPLDSEAVSIFKLKCTSTFTLYLSEVTRHTPHWHTEKDNMAACETCMYKAWTVQGWKQEGSNSH